LASDEGCTEGTTCLDLFPGTCPISLTALVVFVVGTAGCVMVIIIYFTRTHHEKDNVTVEDADHDEGDILLAETPPRSKKLSRRKKDGEETESDELVEDIAEVSL